MNKISFLFVFIFFSTNLFGQVFSESIAKNYSIALRLANAESNLKYYSIKSGVISGVSDNLSINLKSQNNFSSESIGINYSIISQNNYSNTSQSNYYKISNSVLNQNVNSSSNIKASSIPKSNNISKNTFAVIIGNEDYKSFQPNLNSEQNVPFALNDANSFRDMCINTLGLLSENIIFLSNAGYIQIKKALDQVNLISKHSLGKANIIFYYAGHGLPNESTKEPYIVPVDVSSSSMEYAIPLKDIFSKLTEYPSDKVVVFLDACFTGAGRNSGLISSRGVKIKPKETAISGNIVVFCSSRETESSLSYNEKQHGLFSYFLIDKVSETNGTITLYDLDKYLRETVSLKSILINKQEQTPQTYISSDIENRFVQLKLIE